MAIKSVLNEISITKPYTCYYSEREILNKLNEDNNNDDRHYGG